MAAEPDYHATMLRDVALEGGGALRAGTRVRVWSEVGGTVGVEWRDGDGSHVLAVRRDAIRPDPAAVIRIPAPLPRVEPAAMQVWRGKGEAREYELRLIAVEGDAVTFERTRVPAKHNLAAGLSVMRRPLRCTVGQLEAAFEYDREATEEDLC